MEGLVKQLIWHFPFALTSPDNQVDWEVCYGVGSIINQEGKLKGYRR